MTSPTIPCDTHRQMPQRSLSSLFCCLCLKDRPRQGGKHEGPLFKCAACLASLAKAEVPK